jgi:hypothetical protein
VVEEAVAGSVTLRQLERAEDAVVRRVEAVEREVGRARIVGRSELHVGERLEGRERLRHLPTLVGVPGLGRFPVEPGHGFPPGTKWGLTQF